METEQQRVALHRFAERSVFGESRLLTKRRFFERLDAEELSASANALQRKQAGGFVARLFRRNA